MSNLLCLVLKKVVVVTLQDELETNLFQMQAMANIEVMNAYEVQKVIWRHTANTLKNEYPDLGGKYDVSIILNC